MKQHTDGPWICHSGAVWKGATPIAYMDRETNDTTPVERDRNAKLIAETPELLRLFKRLVYFTTIDCCAITTEEGIQFYKDRELVISKANALIDRIKRH